MKIKLSIIVLLFASAISSCKQELDLKEMEYQELKTMPYATMSQSEKETFKLQLSQKLSMNADFKAYSKLLVGQSDAALEAAKERHKRGLKLIKANELRSLSAVERHEKRGIKDPVNYQKNTILLLLELVAVTKKFPELKNLDHKGRIEVFNLASKKQTKSIQ